VPPLAGELIASINVNEFGWLGQQTGKGQDGATGRPEFEAALADKTTKSEAVMRITHQHVVGTVPVPCGMDPS
jgi:hypothetical protein